MVSAGRTSKCSTALWDWLNEHDIWVNVSLSNYRDSWRPLFQIVNVLKKITERGKIVISTFAVYAIIDSNEPDIVAGKNDFCVLLLRIQIPAVNQFCR